MRSLEFHTQKLKKDNCIHRRHHSRSIHNMALHNIIMDRIDAYIRISKVWSELQSALYCIIVKSHFISYKTFARNISFSGLGILNVEGF